MWVGIFTGTSLCLLPPNGVALKGREDDGIVHCMATCDDCGHCRCVCLARVMTTDYATLYLHASIHGCGNCPSALPKSMRRRFPHCVFTMAVRMPVHSYPSPKKRGFSLLCLHHDSDLHAPVDTDPEPIRRCRDEFGKQLAIWVGQKQSPAKDDDATDSTQV